MKTQDSAFALLIESYRLIQARNIEQDFQARLTAAANIENEVERAEIITLARKERQLRLEQLQAFSSGFGEMYESSRPSSQTEDSASRNSETAARELENFVAIKRVDISKSLKPVTEVVPASEVLQLPVQP
jgi:hypothetical protein